MDIMRTLVRLFTLILAVGLCAYIFIANSTPVGITETYKLGSKQISGLGPSSRELSINGINKQTENLIYFTSKMPFKFDHVKVKVTFKNPSGLQKILMGYRDQDVWHYNTQTLDEPFMDNLDWQKIGSESFLYQKNPTYRSMSVFFSKPPENKVVGVFDYSNSDFLQPNIILPNYKPTQNKTFIDEPLRGNVVMYAYLNHEPFNMTITKQDLNWYGDPDTTKISVYKSQDKVYEATIDDDGNSTNNHKIGQKQSININNPGPGLPEPGVYKIVIDTSIDSIITNITTNLHKVVFEGPLYVANNSDIYKGIVKKTQQSILTTNAQQLNFRTDHNRSYILMVDKQTINIAQPNQVVSATNTAAKTTVYIPNSDMIVNGSGYFALSADQFFEPTPYKILPINSADDVSKADYILTNYKKPERVDGWLTTEREFSIPDAFTQNRQLSWLIEAPGLKENNRTVEYKQIDMTLSKKGWFKQ
jgi:preprotein translocase subunit SecG